MSNKGILGDNDLLRGPFSGLLYDLAVKLNCEDGPEWVGELKRFLQREPCWVDKLGLLEQIAIFHASANEKFVAEVAFGPENPDGIKFYLGSNFEKHFLGKIENNVEPRMIAIHQLKKSSRDAEIMSELGIEKRAIKLAHLYEMIKHQSQGQEDEGPFLFDDCLNVAYIEEDCGDVLAVSAYLDSSSRYWSVDADSVDDRYGWCEGSHVISQV